MLDRFGTISSINVHEPSTWRGRLFLTIDVDWAIDEVLADTADVLIDAGVAATWFVTHPTPLLDRLRGVGHFELGIHPNFNDLLHGRGGHGKGAGEILEDLLRFVPEARSVRSHSMAQSSVLLDEFRRRGLTHDANHFIPSGSGVHPRPWSMWNGITRVPYVWEDDVHCLYQGLPQSEVEPIDLADDVSRELKVFDFHPIHIFLNTESMDRYERTRALHRHPQALVTQRFEGHGTRSRLMQLISGKRVR